MPFAYWCILIMALMPLSLVAYAKAGARDNNAPRDAAERLTGARRRAYAAHQNAYENFPFFAVAVIVAMEFGGSVVPMNMLAALFMLFRVLYAWLYIADIATARSGAYLGGLLCTIGIFLLPALK